MVKPVAEKNRRGAADTASPTTLPRRTSSGAGSSCRLLSYRGTGRGCRKRHTRTFHRYRGISYSHSPLRDVIKDADGKFAVLAVLRLFIQRAVTLERTITGNEEDLSQPVLFKFVRRHPIDSHLPGSYGQPVIIPERL